MEIIYLKALIVFILIVVGSPVIMESTPSEAYPLSVSSQGQNLGFVNQTGRFTTAAQVSSFINFINSGSIYFRNDTQARLQYISDKMNSQYANITNSTNGTNGFTVIQMTEDTQYFDWTIYTSTFIYASVAAGVDMVFPHYSYAFVLNNISSEGRTYFYYPGQKGIGIDSTLETVIKNTILYVETTSTCSCFGSTQTILNLLYQYDSSQWNLFCSATDTTFYPFYAAIYTKSKKYFYVKPKNCYYLLYLV